MTTEPCLITERRGLYGALPPVQGWVVEGLFGVHAQSKGKVFGKGRWCITHLPTGYFLCGCPARREALSRVAALLALAVPWRTKSVKVLRRYRKEISTVLPGLVSVG